MRPVLPLHFERPKGASSARLHGDGERLGARTLNGGHTAPVVVTEADGAAGEDLAAVRDLGGAGTPVYVASPDGSVRLTVSAD